MNWTSAVNIFSFPIERLQCYFPWNAEKSANFGKAFKLTGHNYNYHLKNGGLQLREKVCFIDSEILFMVNTLRDRNPSVRYLGTQKANPCPLLKFITSCAASAYFF